MRDTSSTLIRSPDSGGGHPTATAGNRTVRRGFVFTTLLLTTLAVCVLTTPPQPADTVAHVEVAASFLVVKGGRLFRPGQTQPFCGIIVERYPGGQLRSRSAVAHGVLHGVSEGWHPGGVRQVREQFFLGTSHGLRTKWHPNGHRLNEAAIVNGTLSGRYRRWHENGQLAEDCEFRDGQPAGLALAFFPSGRPKARVVMKGGQEIERTVWPESSPAANDVSRSFSLKE